MVFWERANSESGVIVKGGQKKGLRKRPSEKDSRLF